MARRFGLVVVGAQDIGDHIAEAADDAVIVQAGHIGERGLDRRVQPCGLGIGMRLWIKPGMEQLR